jgi:hypothetical protein
MPPVIAAYFQAANSHDSDGAALCFASNGIVHDEGERHEGHAAIKAWKEKVSEKYNVIMVPSAIEPEGSGYKVTAKVSGNFPGSPLNMAFGFTLSDDRITLLEITG